MKRRLNFTGRKRIPREDISIVLTKDAQGNAKSFNAKIDLDSLNLPPDMAVYIEAYRRYELKRFAFGTVGNIQNPPDTLLSDLSNTENLKFRVLVVDKSVNGKILAHADRITTPSDLDKRGILPVEFRDLGQQVWCVEFKGEGDAPVLVINKKIPNIQNIAKSDPQFIMNVYPSAFREVLIHMIFIDGEDNVNEPETEWHRDWLDFSRTLLAEGFPESYKLAKRDNPEIKNDWLDWVDAVVAEFCAKRSEWWGYIRIVEDGGQG